MPAPAPAVFAVEGVARHYAWGSPQAIPRLLGVEPNGRPVAELWFGAHPDAPSPAPGNGSTLEQLISADPEALLGPDAVARFGPRLPFLVKLLAADTPLSIQTHPTRAQAEAGFADEESRGVAREAAERNYRDRHHKPELLCALTPFDALCGFRPVAATLRLLDALAVPQLQQARELLAGPDGLRAAFMHLLELPDPAPVVAAVRDRATNLDPDGEWAGPARAVALAAAEFPADPGVLLAVLLNHVRLAPGEAIFLAAGTVHCYLRGLGVEVMANSDNVLRCGLTSKHVDVPQLLAVTDFAPLPQPRCPTRGDGGLVRFSTPAPDFAFTMAEVERAGELRLDGPGPYLVLGLRGAITVQAESGRADLMPGRAAYVAAGAGARVVGTGQIGVATVGGRET